MMILEAITKLPVDIYRETTELVANLKNKKVMNLTHLMIMEVMFMQNIRW